MNAFRKPEQNHSAPPFKVGDTVILNSGGHVMTVISIGDTNDVTCAWSLKDDIKTKVFRVEALKYGNPSPKTLEELIEASMKTTASMTTSLPIPSEKLRAWAASKPTVKALYVFGSYARGEALSASDLDIALEFQNVDEDDAELICNRAAWKAELTQITGITVKDIYHVAAKPVTSGPRVQVFP
jgi:predicted nucleotidyltransferase/uncharacterized protein YodC (DUF2158 family)